MKEIKITIRNEIEKILLNKKLIILSIIGLCSIILLQVFLHFVKSVYDMYTFDFNGFTELVLLYTANVFIPIIICFLVIEVFTSEYKNNTLKIILTKPITRFNVFLSKTIAVFILTVTNMFIFMLTSIILGIIFNFSSFTFSAFFEIIIAYLLTILPVTVLTLLIITISSIVKSASFTFVLSIIVFLALKILSTILPQYSSMFLMGFLEWNNLWMIDNISVIKIIRQSLIMLSSIVMFYTFSLYRFEKSNY
jgi:ABC-2 type transport system permease protein